MKILVKTILLAGLLSFQALADNVSEHSPLIISANARMFDGTEMLWVELSDSDFDKIDRYTTANNTRDRHNIALVKAYGVGNSMYKDSDSKMKRDFYNQSMDYANRYFEGKEVTLYCPYQNTAGFLECLIFRDIENKLGENIRIGYNEGIIESGLSDTVFPFASDPDNPTKVERSLLKSKKIAEKKKIGIWSLKFNFLPDDF